MKKLHGLLKMSAHMVQSHRVKWTVSLLLITLVAVFAALGVARPKQTVDEAYIEQVCGRCHGMSGYTDNSNMPILAGQNTGYLIKQMENFRSGFRRSSVMSPILQDIDDDAIAFIADYYNRAASRRSLKAPASVP